VRNEFLHNAVILQKDAWAFTGVLLEAQLKTFRRFTANMAALYRLLGLLIAPSTAADATLAVKRWHRELMEEVCRGQRDLADLPLEHLRCLLAWAHCPLGVAVLRVALVPSAPARSVDDNKEEEEDNDEEDEE
jgi:hypothetical protein